MSSPEPVSPPWATAPPPHRADPWGLPELSAAASGPTGPGPDPVQRAFDDGYQGGHEAGLAQARAELAPVEDALARLVDQLQQEMALIRPRAEANLYALGVAIARWLLQREITENRTAVEPLIRRAVQLLPAGSPVEIHAGPSDVEALGNHMRLAEADGRPLQVHWVVDPELEPGSFRLISPERIVDGRVDVALRALYERLASE